MRLPRMKTRPWMIAVVVVVVVLGVGKLNQRSRSDASLAKFHAESEKECWRSLEASESMRFDHADRKEWTAYTRGVLRYHARMARKYEHAARYPWLSVEPDPPKPPKPE